jgi:Putative peptidoglycan binding domain
MSEVEDMIAEGGRPEPEVVEVVELPAQPERKPKKVVTPAAELAEVEVVGSPEADRMPVRIELSRLVFRSAMKNSQSVRYLQDLLVEAGCPVGSDPRGWLCEGTRDALSAFQGRTSLPVTGEADESTVEALFARSREYVREL